MKKIFYLLPILLIFSCSDNKIKLEGEFVKVLSQNKELNIYTFDFNNTLKISDNGNNYLITNKKGNKSIATIEKGVLSYNNCKIIIDKNENVLTNTCSENNKSNSNDYWSLYKVEIYLSKIQDLNYEKYINNYLAKIPNEYLGYSFPNISALNENDKKRLDKVMVAKNKFYPFMCFGDFNNDNKYPDIAILTSENPVNLLDEHSYFTSLYFLHAGNEKLINSKLKNKYLFMNCNIGEKIGNEGEQNDTIIIYDLTEEWSSWSVYWKNGRYNTKYIDLRVN